MPKRGRTLRSDHGFSFRGKPWNLGRHCADRRGSVAAAQRSESGATALPPCALGTTMRSETPEPPTLRHRLKRLKNRSLFRLYETFPKRTMPFDAIFVIGTYKTGTTSMHHFFEGNGLRHLTINTFVKRRYASGDLDYLDFLVTRYHSFDDNPWHKLDVIDRYMRREGDFRFILTTRDPQAWFDSYVRHNLRHRLAPPPSHQRAAFIEQNLVRHNDACRELAARYHRPLLELDVTTAQGPEETILRFVGLPDKGARFPHSNPSTSVVHNRRP